jgi:hypothetical protein
LQTALDTATASPFSVSPTVNVTPKYNLTSGLNLALTASGHASGGYVSGGAQLSWLAEEGWGEYVIPTNPSRRQDALDLYEAAGDALGVSKHASGGYAPGSNDSIAGGSYLSDYAQNNNLFNEVTRNASSAYNESTEGGYEDNTPTYVPVSASVGNSGGENSTAVEVSVNVNPQFNIQGGEGQSEDDIMQVIRKHMKEMADELGGEIAERLGEVFSNMPLKEA